MRNKNNKKVVITNITWCDEMGDRLDSNGLPDNVEVPVSKLNVSANEDGSSKVWQYLFNRFGAFSDSYDFTII
jgi:hypothetical protein